MRLQQRSQRSIGRDFTDCAKTILVKMAGMFTIPGATRSSFDVPKDVNYWGTDMSIHLTEMALICVAIGQVYLDFVPGELLYSRVNFSPEEVKDPRAVGWCRVLEVFSVVLLIRQTSTTAG